MVGIVTTAFFVVVSSVITSIVGVSAAFVVTAFVIAPLACSIVLFPFPDYLGPPFFWLWVVPLFQDRNSGWADVLSLLLLLMLLLVWLLFNNF